MKVGVTASWTWNGPFRSGSRKRCAVPLRSVQRCRAHGRVIVAAPFTTPSGQPRAVPSVAGSAGRRQLREPRVRRGHAEAPPQASIPELRLPEDVLVCVDVRGVEELRARVLADRTVDPARVASETARVAG